MDLGLGLRHFPGGCLGGYSASRDSCSCIFIYSTLSSSSCSPYHKVVRGFLHLLRIAFLYQNLNLDMFILSRYLHLHSANPHRLSNLAVKAKRIMKEDNHVSLLVVKQLLTFRHNRINIPLSQRFGQITE